MRVYICSTTEKKRKRKRSDGVRNLHRLAICRGPIYLLELRVQQTSKAKHTHIHASFSSSTYTLAGFTSLFFFAALPASSSLSLCLVSSPRAIEKVEVSTPRERKKKTTTTTETHPYKKKKRNEGGKKEVMIMIMIIKSTTIAVVQVRKKRRA